MIGKKQVEVRCPKCGAVFLAYAWSLAGSGKRCECGHVCGHFDRVGFGDRD